MPRCLSFHATYRCGRTGACCSSNWPIPIEADRLARLRAAIASGTLVFPDEVSARRWLAEPFPRSRHASADTAALVGTIDGQCVFLASDGGHRCRIHTTLGHESLPLACRQFPRVSIRDPRGVSVTLSAYCPTVATLLSTPGPVTIVDAPPAFPDGGEYVGLETRDGWPPILRPGVLMDWPSWWEFERRAVDFIGNVATSPEGAMAGIYEATEHIRSWMVAEGALLDHVQVVFDEVARQRPGDYVLTDPVRARRLAEVESAIPPEVRPASRPIAFTPETPHRIQRFLASHAFANWAVHLGEDIRAWFTSVETAYVLLTSGFDVREADLRLRHLISPTGL